MAEGDPNAQAAPPQPAQAADPDVAKLKAQVADLSARLTALEQDVLPRVKALEERKPPPPPSRKPPLFKHRLAS